MLEVNCVQNVKVSVIVPVYNVEKYLSVCLDSLINQTLKDIEIICINDGSKDNSLMILEEYAQRDNRLKVISQANQGLSCTRNTGLSLARGEFVAFCDSDDWVDGDFYEKLYNAAVLNKCDIAACGCIRHYRKTQVAKLSYKESQVYTEISNKLDALDIPDFNYVWNKIYKRIPLLNSNILFPNGRYYEDIYWSIRVVDALSGVVTVPDVNYHYLEVPTSITKQKQSYKHKSDAIWALAKLYDYYKEKNIPLLKPLGQGKKKWIKLFGIKFISVEYYYPNLIKTYLFGFVPFVSIESKY